jgi:hypothetical protein
MGEMNIQEFLTVAVPPGKDSPEWLEGALNGVDYIVRNGRSHEIILYTNVGQSYVHSVLAPLAKVSPADGVDLQRALIGADSHWRLEHVSGGGEPDRMYLGDPLDHPGSSSLVGGEQLVFRRHFHDVDKGPTRTELSQRLVQALDLYFMEEESAYCRMNEDGDVEPIIRVRDLSEATGQESAVLVTIEAEQLHRYMAVAEMALVMKFDFTRYRSNGFAGWNDDLKRASFDGGDLHHHSGAQAGASFVNGVSIIRPLLTKDMLIKKSRRDWDDSEKQYATFKAHDWKNKRLAEISCAPDALASYFDEESLLPFQTTPAFFKPDALLKYKADPEKYTLDHRTIRSRGGWSLRSYDVNDAGQVHAYLCDLAKLPYSEQLYWQSFNEWPKSGISARAIQTDFQGNFSTIPDPLEELKGGIGKINDAKPAWWKPRSGDAASAVHYPITPSPEEWSNAILALDQYIVEGFVPKALKVRLEDSGGKLDPNWGSIRLVQECLVAAGLSSDEAVNTVEPLKRVHFLRTKLKGHLAEKEKQALIKQARSDHGSLATHLRRLAEDIQISFERIVEAL